MCREFTGSTGAFYRSLALCRATEREQGVKRDRLAREIAPV